MRVQSESWRRDLAMRVPNESLERDLIGGVGKMCQTKQESHGPKKASNRATYSQFGLTLPKGGWITSLSTESSE